MTRASTSLCCIAAIFLAVGGAAQQAPAPARDPQAVALLQAAINAMGGQAVAQSITTVSASGSIDAGSKSFTWEDDFTSGHEFRRQLTDGFKTRLLVSGHGNPATAVDSKSKGLNQHVAYAIWPLHVPIVMLSRILQNTNYSLALGNQVTIGNSVCYEVIAKDQSGPVAKLLGSQRWCFDATTGLPLRLEYRVPDTAYVESFEVETVDYSDFRKVSGILMPFSLVISKNGKATNTATVDSVDLNAAIGSSEFDIAGVQQ